MSYNNSEDTKSVLELNGKEAKDFFLRNISYFSQVLPSHFDFSRILKPLSELLIDKEYKTISARKHNNVNYKLYSSKDGKYSWRPFELINPLIYVLLVHDITSGKNWRKIINRFKKFSKITNIDCLSIPVQSPIEKEDTKEQILHWWEGVEQKSIELALEYNLVFHTDVSNCYPDIYTHSIAWALHDKEIAKKNRNDKTLIGNKIDNYIMDMRYGQTNGIPQGSVLMDFIAEMILGYADILLNEEIKKIKPKIKKDDYKILRYRDDYRIFVNSSLIGEKILKALTEVLLELGLSLNSSKTYHSDDIIASSIKPGKIAWWQLPTDYWGIQSGPDSTNNDSEQVDIEEHYTQRKLLLIYIHSRQHPNSGSIKRPLSSFYKNLINMSDEKKKKLSKLPLISIVTEIAYSNPTALEVCFSILSVLMDHMELEEAKALGKKIVEKFRRLPNTEIVDIWLHRILYHHDKEYCTEEPLCKVITSKESVTIWNTDFLNNIKDTALIEEIKEIMSPEKFIDREALNKQSRVIDEEEFNTFYRPRISY